MSEPLANVPVVIFQYAMSPYDEWHALAWAGALVLTAFVLGSQPFGALSRPRRRNMIDLLERRWPTQTAPSARRPRSTFAMLGFLYGTTEALRHVDLAVPANAVTAIIGPSGCGKSTLLRAINRIYELYPDQRADGES